MVRPLRTPQQRCVPAHDSSTTLFWAPQHFSSRSDGKFGETCGRRVQKTTATTAATAMVTVAGACRVMYLHEPTDVHQVTMCIVLGNRSVCYVYYIVY